MEAQKDLDWGMVLTMVFILKEWKEKPLNEEGYLVIKDFDKFTDDFNKWKLEKYPYIDTDKKFKGDLNKFIESCKLLLLKEEE
jgi:hypothetical protein